MIAAKVVARRTNPGDRLLPWGRNGQDKQKYWIKKKGLKDKNPILV